MNGFLARDYLLANLPIQKDSGLLAFVSLTVAGQQGILTPFLIFFPVILLLQTIQEAIFCLRPLAPKKVFTPLPPPFET